MHIYISMSAYKNTKKHGFSVRRRSGAYVARRPPPVIGATGAALNPIYAKRREHPA